MEAKLLEKGKEKSSVIFKDVKPAFLNTIRRLIEEEVTSMAIEDVEIRQNTSILYDEMLGHRLGLVPLTTDLKSYNLPEECKCEGKGCARCQVKMTLEGKGPGIVYSGDIKSKDSAIKPVHNKIPIVQLLKGQSIELEATAVLGKGKTHSKWIPAIVYYKHKPLITISNKCDESYSKCVEVCPTKTLEMSNKKVSVSKDHLLDCHLCGACVEASNGEITVEPDKEIIFTIEPFGQLDNKKIMQEAIKKFQDMLNDFTKSLKEA
ncbi:DNA-directed RNA polymerase subunit D [Nanoarchaeota archaeon]